MTADKKEEPKKVFISGSIEIKEIPPAVRERLKNIKENRLHVLVGDAPGIDSEIQKFFADQQYYHLTVYYIYETPRNCTSNKFVNKPVTFPEKLKNKKNKERERQSYKDERMTEDSDYSLIIWDGQSKGSRDNIIRALKREQKQVVVYLNGGELPKKECTKEEIMRIYHENNGYSTSEIVKHVIEAGVCDGFNTKQLNKFLKKEKIITVNVNSKKTEAHPELSEEKKSKYIFKRQYKGRDTKEIRYTKALLDFVLEEIKKSNSGSPDMFSN